MLNDLTCRVFKYNKKIYIFIIYSIVMDKEENIKALEETITALEETIKTLEENIKALEEELQASKEHLKIYGIVF